MVIVWISYYNLLFEGKRFWVLRFGQSKRWTLSEQIGYGVGVANVWKQEDTKYGNNRVKVETRRYLER